MSMKIAIRVTEKKTNQKNNNKRIEKMNVTVWMACPYFVFYCIYNLLVLLLFS